MKKHKAAAILFLCTCIVFLTGCWNYREVEKLSIVAGVAIDRSASGQGYHLTVETLSLVEGSDKPPKPNIIESDGESIFDAIRNTIKKSEKKLFFSHCKVVILSSQIAGEGINSIIDWFNRDSEPRITIDFLVSKEKTAKEILLSKGVTDPITSYEINSTLENNLHHLGKSNLVPIYRVNNLLNGEGVSLALPAIKLEKVQSTAEKADSGGDSGSDGGQTQQSKTPSLDGIAVFKGDKAIGYLDGDRSKYYLILKNNLQGGLLLLDHKENGKTITIEVTSNETKIKPIMSQGQPTMQIDVKTKGILGEDDTPEGHNSLSGISAVEKYANETIENHVKDVITLVQKQYDSDIFGFGNKIYCNNFSAWQELKPKWDETFKTLKCNVKAQVTITSTAIEKSKGKEGN